MSSLKLFVFNFCYVPHSFSSVGTSTCCWCHKIFAVLNKMMLIITFVFIIIRFLFVRNNFTACNNATFYDGHEQVFCPIFTACKKKQPPVSLKYLQTDIVFYLQTDTSKLTLSLKRKLSINFSQNLIEIYFSDQHYKKSITC